MTRILGYALRRVFAVRGHFFRSDARLLTEGLAPRGGGGEMVESGSDTIGSCGGACGIGLRPEARFCDRCGAPPVSRRTVTGEHKQVTVLFMDIVGSMKLAAALDAERLREIVTDLFNRAAAVVQRYQGTVDTFTGDGLMALFGGAPLALDDHPLRACIAALEIQSVVAELAAEVRTVTAPACSFGSA